MAERVTIDLEGEPQPGRRQPLGVGARIRYLRRQRQITLDQLANAANITKSYLSKVERGVSVPSISTVLKVAKSLGISVSQLVGEEQDSDSISVVRRSERKPFMREGSPLGYNYESVGGTKKFKNMEPFIMTPPPEIDGDMYFEHSGEEFIFVLSGTIKVEFPNKYVLLEEGDAVYFDSLIPHRTRALGKVPARALVVVTTLD